MSDFHIRYACACGWSCRPEFGSAFFAECDHPVCPECGSSASGYQRHVVDEVAASEAFNRFMFVAAILMIVALALSGCASSTIVRPDTPLRERIPASLLTCADRPSAGSLDRQSDVAKYVVELDQAGEDCRRKVRAVGQIVEAEGEVK